MKPIFTCQDFPRLMTASEFDSAVKQEAKAIADWVDAQVLQQFISEYPSNAPRINTAPQQEKNSPK